MNQTYLQSKTGILTAVLVVLSTLFFLIRCKDEQPVHEDLSSVLWMKTSAEYRALTEQCYRAAKENVDLALSDPAWTAALEQEEPCGHLPPAVVLDVDETVIDNAPYEARLVRDGTGHDQEKWDRWVQRSEAAPIPGALDFISYVRGKGITVVYITNRKHQLEAATRENLLRLGFPVVDAPDAVLTRGEKPDWGRDKSSRRAHLCRSYRILLVIGDNLNDFVSGAYRDPENRALLVDQYKTYWGERWIVLPNPAYGSWEGALYGFDYDLPQSEKQKKMYEGLHPAE